MILRASSFYARILISDLVALLFCVVVYINLAPLHAYAILVSTVATTLNAIIGFYYIRKYLHASTEDFNSYIYGSTFGRLLGMMLVIGLILLYSNFPQITFILSLFISYIYKSVLEIIFIHKNYTQRHEKS